jgi:hypothetical protein
MKAQDNKPWYKLWWIWAIVIAVLSGVGYVANPDSANKSNSSDSTTTNTPVPKQWTKVSELSGDLKEKSGDVFTVAGGNIRIKYAVNATSDSGTALLYLLPEGSTITKNAKGEMDIAVQELTTIGNKTGEKIVQKPQGNYYVYINTSSVKDYAITVEEQK